MTTREPLGPARRTEPTRTAGALLLLGALVAAGCAAPLKHLTHEDHPWHSGPLKAVMVVGSLPAYPVALVEQALTGDSFHGGVVTPLLVLPGAAAGFVVGVATYVVLFPLEFAVPLDDDDDVAPPRPRPEPDPTPRPEDASSSDGAPT